ncbi:BMP family protein [Euzebya sp.]|uniref:BMP family lipoprotein n=1 Tax=Euzebya sp. TaxID=1971409 RepID=UPI0035162600
MTTLHRRTAMLALLLILSLVAAACADDPEDTGDEEATEEAAAEPTEEEAAEPPEEEAPATEEEPAATEEEPAATEEEPAATEGEATTFTTLEDACAAYEGVEIPEDFNVGLVTDIGRVDDGTFNQFAYDGMQAASECLGFETSFIETASEADYATNITSILDGDPEVVVTVGFLIADATLEAANNNPDVNFIGIDQFQEEFPENYVGILFREDQGGFLAGAMGALLSESGTIGAVGGLETVPPVVRFLNGYQTGAQYVNPDINVLTVYTDSFTDPAQGQSAAQQFLGEGADVIFGAGGQTGSGAIQTAAENGAWAIGVDQDEYFTTFGGGSSPGADRLATSAVKRVDLGTFIQIGDVLAGSFEGGIFTLDAANGGITYAPFHDADIPEDVATQIEEIRAGLADGSIETGVDPATGELL